MADFTLGMTAIDWGWSIEDTAQKLPEVSEKARERVQLIAHSNSLGDAVFRIRTNR
jgi:hypothetical protein